jgi:hypothetical protein
VAVPVNAFLFATLLPQEQAARRAAESGHGVDGP